MKVDLTKIPETSLTSWECSMLARGETEYEIDYPETSMTAEELMEEARANPRPIPQTSNETWGGFWGVLTIVAGPIIGLGILFWFLMSHL